jgi:1-acyl-sn-glycerol-3-phosphate acyltransferase
MIAVRSAAFGVLLYGYLILFLLVFLPVFHFSGDDFAWRMTRRWGRSAMRLHRFVVGTDAAFEGVANIPAGASIVASKHQSYWETLSFVTVLDRPAFILKQELMRIPLFGTYMRRLGMIPVDRTRRGWSGRTSSRA